MAEFTAACGTKRPPPSSSSSDTTGSATSPSPPSPFIPPPVPPGWTRCHAYVERKHRFCRQQCQGKAATAAVGDKNSNGGDGGPRYCGNHQHLFYCTTMESTLTETPQSDSGNKNIDKNKSNNQVKQRIPCPIDPTHHIPADKLEKHILICPKIKQLRAMEKLYYYRDNLNTGGHGCLNMDLFSLSSSVQETSSEQGRDIEWAKRVALCVLKVHDQVFSKKKQHQHPQSKPDSSETSNNHDKNHLYCMSHEDIVKALPLQDLSSSSQQQQQQQHEEKSNLARAIQAYNIKSGGPKHVHQQASLLGHLRQLGAIPTMTSSSFPAQPQQQSQQPPEPKRRRRIINIMELGAGRGMMGLVAAGVVAAAAARRTSPINDAVTDTTLSTTTTTRLILVERSGCRSKADRILRNHKNHAGPFNNTLAKKKTTTATNTTSAANDDEASSDLKTTEESTGSTTTLSATTAASISPTTPHPPPIKDYMNLQDLEWSRIQCDLAHVDMKEVLKHSGSGGGDGDPSSAIPEQQQQQQQPPPRQQEPVEEELHVVAKHLCGVGTDLALKSLHPIRNSISTCLLATCCHGICSWKDYVGRDYLQSVMTDSNINNYAPLNGEMMHLAQFGEAEFELLCQWSAGTVATNWTDSKTGSNGGGGDKKKISRPDLQKHGNDGDDDDDDNEHKTAGSNNNNKDSSAMGVSTIVEALDLKCGVQGLGRACQRLIDYGRLEYIRHVLFGSDSSSAAATTTTTAATACTACPLCNEDKDCDVELVYYVPPEITPQNAALRGRRRR